VRAAHTSGDGPPPGGTGRRRITVALLAVQAAVLIGWGATAAAAGCGDHFCSNSLGAIPVAIGLGILVLAVTIGFGSSSSIANLAEFLILFAAAEVAAEMSVRRPVELALWSAIVLTAVAILAVALTRPRDHRSPDER
jgi:hypothetical protein